jgi:hypothetical protein
MFFPLIFPAVPSWLIVVVAAALAVALIMQFGSRRIVGRMSRSSVARMESSAAESDTARDRLAVSIGWGAVHDAFGSISFRRRIARWLAVDVRLASRIASVTMETERARTALHDLRLAEQGRFLHSQPTISPIVAGLVVYGLALPADVALTTTAVTGREDISEFAATPLAMALSAALFLGSKLLVSTALTQPLHRGRLATGIGGVVFGVVTVVELRTTARLRWATLALLPVVVTGLATCLSFDPSGAWCRRVEKNWNRRRKVLLHEVSKLQRGCSRTIWHRTLALGRMTGRVVALDHLARGGFDVGRVADAAASLNSQDTLRRLGVLSGPDSLDAAAYVLDQLQTALAPSEHTDLREGITV